MTYAMTRSYVEETELRSLFLLASRRRCLRADLLLIGQILLCWLGLALLFVSLAHAEGPTPTPSVRILPGLQAGTKRVVYSVSALGNPDSVVATVTYTGQTTSVKGFPGGAKTDTLTFPAPLAGDSVTATVQATAWKNKAPSPPSAIVKAGYREPIPAPTVTVKLVVLPPNAVLQGGQSSPLCVFGLDNLGRKVKTRQAWNSGPCEALYRAWRAT